MLDIPHRQPHGNIPKNRDKSTNRAAIRYMMSIRKEKSKEKIKKKAIGHLPL
jgi:hypothetical protein